MFKTLFWFKVTPEDLPVGLRGSDTCVRGVLRLISMEVESDVNLRAEVRKASSPAQRGKRGRPLPPLSPPLLMSSLVIIKCLINQPHPAQEAHFLLRRSALTTDVPPRSSPTYQHRSSLHLSLLLFCTTEMCFFKAKNSHCFSDFICYIQLQKYIS